MSNRRHGISVEFEPFTLTSYISITGTQLVGRWGIRGRTAIPIPVHRGRIRYALCGREQNSQRHHNGLIFYDLFGTSYKISLILKELEKQQECDKFELFRYYYFIINSKGEVVNLPISLGDVDKHWKGENHVTELAKAPRYWPKEQWKKHIISAMFPNESKRLMLEHEQRVSLAASRRHRRRKKRTK